MKAAIPQRRRRWLLLEVDAPTDSVDLALDHSPVRMLTFPRLSQSIRLVLRLELPATQIVSDSLGASTDGARCVMAISTVRALWLTLARTHRGQRFRTRAGDRAWVLRAAGSGSGKSSRTVLRRFARESRRRWTADQFELSDVLLGPLASRLDGPWPAPPALAAPQAPADFAVYVHLFYEDLWPDCLHALDRMSIAADLHVSVASDRPDLAQLVARTAPGARVHRLPNRGRDIAPFQALLQAGTFDAYTAVCKIHTKKSPHLSAKGVADRTGRRWFRSALYALLAADGRARDIAEAFRSQPALGLVGPANLRLPREGVPYEVLFPPRRRRRSSERLVRENWRHAHRLADAIGLPADLLRPDFFAGSMFWLRPAALAPLKRLTLAMDDYPAEPMAKDGTVVHAIERLFNPVCQHAGYRIDTVPLRTPKTATDAPFARRNR